MDQCITKSVFYKGQLKCCVNRATLDHGIVHNTLKDKLPIDVIHSKTSGPSPYTPSNIIQLMSVSRSVSILNL